MSRLRCNFSVLNRQTSGVRGDWHAWNAVYDEVDRNTINRVSVTFPWRVR